MGLVGSKCWRIVLAAMNRAFCGWVKPRLEMRRGLELRAPDWKEASMPAKANKAPLCMKRRTSPISAMSCGSLTSPAPCMAMTTSNSGSVEFFSVRLEEAIAGLCASFAISVRESGKRNARLVALAGCQKAC